MPRIRTIKPEFWGSPDTAAASPRARLLYIAMWNWADDYGVGQWTERELLGFAFPNDHDVTVEDFPHIVKEVADTFGTTFYVNRGRRYYAIPAWDAHQKTERRAQGKYPTPDDADSAPDQAFSSVAESLGSSAATLGSSSLGKGTGEQGNREQGTGETALAVPDLFDAFWSLWPRKEGKADAAKAWAKAIRKIDQTLLLELARQYVQHPNRPAKQFVPHGATWLNGERWNDGEPTAPESHRPMSNTEHNAAYVRSLMAQEQQGAPLEIAGAA